MIAAKTLAGELRVPVVPVHHMAAHVLSPRVAEPSLQFPYLALIVSGGHTFLARVFGARPGTAGDMQLVGSTLDDSLGEAYDKAARMLRVGLHLPHRRLQPRDAPTWPATKTSVQGPPPGVAPPPWANFQPTPGKPEPWSDDPPVQGHLGAALEELAQAGRAEHAVVRLPVPLSNRKGKPRARAGIAFSFSGLKSALRRATEQPGVDTTDFHVAANLAAEFTTVAARHVHSAVRQALTAWAADVELGRCASMPTALVIAGGAAANQALRQSLQDVASEFSLTAMYPPLPLCTDNGVMVAAAAAELLRCDASRPAGPIDFAPRWPLDGDPVLGPLPGRAAGDHSAAQQQCRQDARYEQVWALAKQLQLHQQQDSVPRS